MSGTGMSGTAAAGAGAPADLLARWERLRQEEPGARPRDAALRLGVGEAELVAARCGAGSVRLDGRWGAMFEAFPALGPIMTLTRNDAAVHEKTGRFEKVSVFGKGVLVLGADIDLRVDLSVWRHGYAVTDVRGDGELRSLQFYDAAGDAVQKIYLRDGTDRDAWDRLVAGHAAADQSPGEAIVRSPPPPPPGPAAPIDAAALRRRWRGLQDVHEFAGLLGAFGVGRVRAFREVGTEFAEPIRPAGFCAALEQAAATELPIMVFVPNPGNVQIHTGPVNRLKRMGPWFNVLDPGFNLHLRDGDIATAWAVRKPTRDGGVTSIEIFDAQDRQIAWMFGQREPGAPERAEWRRLVAGLPRLETDGG